MINFGADVGTTIWLFSIFGAIILISVIIQIVYVLWKRVNKRRS